MDGLGRLPLVLGAVAVASALLGAVLLGIVLLSPLPTAMAVLVVATGVAGAGLGAMGLGARIRARVMERWEGLIGALETLGAAERRDGRVSELRPEPDRRLAAAVNRLLQVQTHERQNQEADRRLLGSLVGRTPNGVLVVGRDGRIRLMNDAFRAIFSAPEAAIGRVPAEVVAVPELLDLLEVAASDEDPVEVITVAGARDVLLRSITTEVNEVAILAQDITRFRAAERARTAFVANISHELRTPMAAILGYAETLLEDRDDLPQNIVPLLDAVARNSRRLRDTFEGLMHLARIEARSGQLPQEVLRLAPLIADAVAPAVDAAAIRSVAFEVSCAENLSAATNAEAFDVIVNNLASNAVKYTPAGGRVSVSVRREGDTVVLEVADTGIGIDAVHQDRVFERFFRVDEGRATQAGGIGLGLAMVKHLCLATGAHIALQSTPDQGSTFRVTLPGAPSRATTEQES